MIQKYSSIEIVNLFLGSPADFGKPSFYSKERKNSVQSYNRPVVDLIR